MADTSRAQSLERGGEVSKRAGNDRTVTALSGRARQVQQSAPGTRVRDLRRVRQGTVMSDKEYQAAFTEKRLQERRARGEARKRAEAEALASRTAATSTDMWGMPLTVGPQPTAGQVTVSGTGQRNLGEKLVKGIAIGLIIGWYPVQLLLAGMGAITFLGGFAAGAALSPLLEVGKIVGIEIESTFGILIGGGAGVWVLNIFFSLAIFAFAASLVLLNQSSHKNKTNAQPLLAGLFVFLLYVFFPLWPWGIHWVTYVTRNPE